MSKNGWSAGEPASLPVTDQNTTLFVGFGPAKASVPEGMNTRLVSEETALNPAAEHRRGIRGWGVDMIFTPLMIYLFFTIDECGA